MEKEIKIKTTDNHLIYGTLNELKKPDKLIIFVHGLTGDQNEHIFYNAVKFFPKRGYATFRFDLYSGEKKGRSLSKCTIKLHAQDLNRVIAYFKKRFKKVFLVGHSLGGATILVSDISKTTGVVLWDPSCNLGEGLVGIDKYCKYNRCLNAYIFQWGTEYIIGKKMYEEWKDFPGPKELMKKVHKPIKIICAGKGVLVKGGKEYFKYATKPKAFVIINQAYHNFDEEGIEEKLFQETLSWIKKY